MKKKTLLVCGLFLLSALTMAGQGKEASFDKWMGTWKLNIEKTKFVRAAVKSRTMKLEPAPSGMKVTIDAVTSQDVPQHLEYTLPYDGKEVSIALVAAGAQTGSCKRIDAYIFETVTKTNGATVATNRYVVSRDGKTMTSTDLRFIVNPDLTSNPDPSGTSTLIYEKQL